MLVLFFIASLSHEQYLYSAISLLRSSLLSCVCLSVCLSCSSSAFQLQAHKQKPKPPLASDNFTEPSPLPVVVFLGEIPSQLRDFRIDARLPVLTDGDNRVVARALHDRLDGAETFPGVHDFAVDDYFHSFGRGADVLLVLASESQETWMKA